MSKPPRDRNGGGSNTYFITANAWEGTAVFQAERMATLFLATIFGYRDQRKFQLHEFVVMPNHVHLILTRGPAITLERCMQFIKGGFSHRAGKALGLRNEIWQRGYVDHRVRDVSDYAQHRIYIHQNPVSAHLAETPEQYPYSSAHSGFVLDPAPQGLKPVAVPRLRHD